MKLLDRIKDLNRKYDLIKLYSNSKIFKIKKSSINNIFYSNNLYNFELEDFLNNHLNIQIIYKIRVSKITNLDFHKICKPYIGYKETYIVR